MSIEQLDLLAPSEAPPALNTDVLHQLEQWVEVGWLRALDRALAVFLLDLAPDSDPLVLLAAALASHQLGHGHVCLDLGATLQAPDLSLSLPPEGQEAGRDILLPSQLLGGVTTQAWCDALAASPMVDNQPGGEYCERPLVLHGQRLYLRRYWRYERQVVAALGRRLQARPALPAGLEQGLERLFADSRQHPDWQKLACALAARGAFSIITGGPGTGKTTTVVRLLALLQEPAVTAGQPLRIRLAAPTGKAAARLTESIGRQVGSLQVSAPVREHIPTQVATLHRLLGSRPDTRHFRHHAGNPLALDVLVVDEASMIDLEMMASLLAALPPHARLVLLGDKDQLASVEAGAVLGDLCRDAEAGRYSEDTRQWLEQVGGQSIAAAGLQPGDVDRHPLAQQTVMLRHSHRFGADSGIGELARTVNRADAQAARQVLGQRQYRDLHSHLASGLEDPRLATMILGNAAAADPLPGYGDYLTLLAQQRPAPDLPADDPAWEAWAKSVLEAFDRFQVLCAVRKGPWGVESLNRHLAGLLQRRGFLPAAQGWYEGRPVLVTRNDYGLGLMNGDIGIALTIRERPLHAGEPERMVLRVAFPRNDGSGRLRFVLPSRLSEVETVFAMTVHKSQGSEFAHAMLVLPETRSPLLTKELVYTAITRASRDFTLLETRPGIFEAAVAQPVRRLSGLDLSGGVNSPD
ncbi:exodeoxyribonuclease V subunit alpha [Halopseudomonas sp. SMJS2]|uniref:exodeoxyribonuclease V subunit alpha n=1 Tax=Halopseudomonas sp. SMJS2 TaxID=3041098 RepID=UPI002452BA47|nr:exodeoxyribonuclease V subunit alpha [Halopseudomonas sp. SMJS2]WGK62032.1 exodeoxyribonuclease V subunit alpha [Halopseudomonas sp. SMJS2]